MKKRATEKELEYWRKVARDSAELERETPAPTFERQVRVRDKLNCLLGGDVLPPVPKGWWNEEPPELEFYRIAKARGLLRRPD